MAIWYCQNSSSNINDANNWNSVPAGGGDVLTWANLANGDILRANGKTSININVDVGSESVQVTIDTVTGLGTAGGGFILSGSSALTLYAHLTAGTTKALVASHTGVGANKLSIKGILTGGSASSTFALQNTSTGSVDVSVASGNAIVGGAGASARGLANDSTGILTFTGNVLGSAAAQGIYQSGVANITGVGNVTGGAGAPGIYCNTTGSVNITGTVQAGTAANGHGIQAGTCDIVVSSGNLINTLYGSAVYGKLTYNPGSGNYIAYPKTSGGAGTYYYAFCQDAADVRAGTLPTGAVQGNLVGTLAVPSAAQVLLGVEVDDTNGTYVTTAEADVRAGTTFGAGSADEGTLAVPPAADVIEAVPVDAGVGTYHEATVAEVQDGVMFGPASAYEGEYVGGGGGGGGPLVGAGGLVG